MQLRGVGEYQGRSPRLPSQLGSGVKKGRVVKSRRWTPVGESPAPTPGR